MVCLCDGPVAGRPFFRFTAWFSGLLGVWLLLLALAAGAEEVAGDGFRYAITPVPAFVEPMAAATTGQGEGNLRIRLVDRQLSLLAGPPTAYMKLVLQPLDAQAVRKAAQVYVGFNPEYQQLQVHAIRVIRAGVVRDLTREVKLDLLRREERLEQNIYAGEITAVGVLPDVRAGDVIEFERSVVGENPIFGERYSYRTFLNSDNPVDRVRFRLLHPAGRDLRVAAPSEARLDRQETGGVVIQTARADNLPAISDDPDRPGWFDPRLWLDVSEYRQWSEVAEWAGRVFQREGELSAGLRALLATWRAAGGTPAEQAARALRWTQEEIRYFGIELGENSHRPSHPNLTFERRFGDCKDKSQLLAALLDGLGITARVALVHSDGARGLDSVLPTPHRFNHAIVRAEVDGRVYWLDPTLPPQTGGLERIGAQDYGQALVMGDTTPLVRAALPAGYLERVEVEQRFQVRAYREAVELEWRTTMERSAAERLRWLLASLPREEFVRLSRADLQRVLPAAEAMGDMEITDDPAHNRLTLSQRYRVPELFQYEPGRFRTEILSLGLLEALRLPNTPQRHTPFGLHHPRELVDRIVFRLPESRTLDTPGVSQERGRYWQMRTAYINRPGELGREITLGSLQDHVPTAAMPAYVEETRRLRGQSSMTMNLRVGELDTADRQALGRRLERYERFGKSKSDQLRAEIRALVDVRQIEADIASGKLTDRQRAQAHHARAMNHDHLGEVDAALADVDRAIALAPDKVDYRLTKARILAGNGRNTEALELFRGVDAQQRVSEPEDLRSWGTAHYYLGQYDAAQAKLDAAIDASSGEGALYAAFWRHLAARRAGLRDDRLEGVLSAVAPSAWPRPVADLLLGRMDAAQLEAAARDADKGVERAQLCEAYFYIAQKYLLDGDKDRAGDYFEKVLDLEVTNFVEHQAARRELQALGERGGGLLKWLRSL